MHQHTAARSGQRRQHDAGAAATRSDEGRAWQAGVHAQLRELPWAAGRGRENWQQPDARGDLPPPPHDDRGHTWRHSDAQLAEIIRNGLRDPFNKTPELTMPPFKERLTDQDIQAVITYFKSLWSSEHRAYQEEQNRRPPMSTREPSR